MKGRKGLIAVAIAAMLAAGGAFLNMQPADAQQNATQPQQAEQAKATANEAQDDGRTLVELHPQVRSNFLGMMRGFTESLDQIINALAEGDFKEAARIAEDDLGPAHELVMALRKANVPPEKIAEIRKLARQRMAQALEQGVPDGGLGMGAIAMKVLGKPVPGMGNRMGGMQPGARGGFGPWLPPEMRAMGIQLHLIGAELADLAKAAADKPSTEDYNKVLGKLGELTTQCVACHSAWKVFP